MADEQNAQNNAQNNEQQQLKFEIVRLYTKDISFETPNVPEVFSLPWSAQSTIDYLLTYTVVDQNLFEVVMRFTINAKMEGDKTAFLCEVNQAGLFRVENLPEQGRDGFFNVFVADLLYPYVRETISNLVVKATFPPLNLAPMNFAALYQQKLQHQQQQNQESNAKVENQTEQPAK